MAVLLRHRKLGVGHLLVKKLEELGANAKVRRITLHPHRYLERFYAELGYRRFGGEETVGPHRLIEMEKHFKVNCFSLLRYHRYRVSSHLPPNFTGHPHHSHPFFGPIYNVIGGACRAVQISALRTITV